MKRLISFLVLALLILPAACTRGRFHMEGSPRRHTLFNDAWRFHSGDLIDAQRADFNHSRWEVVNLPHDYMIEGKGTVGGPKEKWEGPFDPASPGTSDSGYLNGGPAWYRKVFPMSETARGRRAFITFEGIYMDSEVWLNGVSLGKRPYGYSSFQYEMTDHLKYGGEPNVLAVRTNVEQPCSRWYSGAGIYRHVWLTITDRTHIPLWGVEITTPEITDAQATVRVLTTVNDESQTPRTDGLPVGFGLETRILDQTGKEISRSYVPNNSQAMRNRPVEQDIILPNPHRWSTDDPYLYTVESTVRSGNKILDRVTNPLGIRTFEWTADDGFHLNGKRLQIQGVCLHHDQGPLGAKAFDRAMERQLEIMKAMGCNAIRCSHNPPAPALLDLCDRMGFIVMDETFDEWKQPKREFGYGRFYDEWSERDTRDMIRRDRNHPSIVAWSIGNEVAEQRTPTGGEVAARLVSIAHDEDPTRPVIAGMNAYTQALRNGFSKALDIQGLNYHVNWYEQAKGTEPVLASETSSEVSTRGDYFLDIVDGKVVIPPRRGNQCNAYDVDHPRWGITAEASMLAVKKYPYIAGEFIWTGFDYIGEPTPFRWPSVSSYFGIVDLCGFPKDRYYLYQAQWQKEKPVVHLLPHWNWPDEFKGKEIPVWCYTNADSVELFLNGKSMGTQDFKSTEGLTLKWYVPYEPGTLKAVAMKDGKVFGEKIVETAGAPAKVVLEADRDQIEGDGMDLSYVTAKIVDAEGRICPTANNLIHFQLEGASTVVKGIGVETPGKIAAVGNGDSTSHQPFVADKITAYNGLALAIIQSGEGSGKLTLTATSPGLAPSAVTITSR